MVRENPEWLGVYFELAHRLRTNPELMEDLKEAAPDETPQAEELFATWQRGGELRPDVPLETVIQFVNVVANGMALATSLGLEFDVDSFPKLVHEGINAQ